MPRRPKFVHPLRTVRLALRKSQPQFAQMFGVSASAIQKIELDERNLSDELADAIMLRLGIDADSLKRRKKPQSLIGSTKAAYTISSVDAETLKLPAGLESTSDEYYAVQKITDSNERLRRSIALWQKITPHWDSDAAKRALNDKLALLFEAVERERKFLPFAMQLSRWIDDAVREFRLRTTINVIRNSRSGNAAEWPTFMDTLSDFRQLKPRPRRRHKR